MSHMEIWSTLCIRNVYLWGVDTMLESIMYSLQDNFLWLSLCAFVIVTTKIALDIFARRSTRRILQDAERLQAEREVELRRRIEQASRRMATVPAQHDATARSGGLRSSLLLHSAPPASGRYHFES